jgi:hypothetical protein
LCGYVWIQGKFPGEQIGVYKTQRRRLKMGVLEGGFACAVRTCKRHDDRAAIQQGKVHFPALTV